MRAYKKRRDATAKGSGRMMPVPMSHRSIWRFH